MVVRRLIEEIAVAANEGTYGMTCFDIVHAYTRVCRDALWSLLSRLGVPASFVQVLKALHEHTRFKVFVHNGYSSEWLTDRGLREGCGAEQSATGYPWKFKVDGHLTRPDRARHSSRGIREIVIGDVEFADDTALFGEVEELHQAEQIFIQTLRDWEQQEHPDKRENLFLPREVDVPWMFSTSSKNAC
ncbi:FCPA [Symbiodinium sp. CCMP2592]|nr:FCPA [Symbiodinium sp. CCMP2592]